MANGGGVAKNVLLQYMFHRSIENTREEVLLHNSLLLNVVITTRTEYMKISFQITEQTLIVFCSPIFEEAGSCRITKEFISSCLSIVDQPSSNVNQNIRRREYNNTVVFVILNTKGKWNFHLHSLSTAGSFFAADVE